LLPYLFKFSYSIRMIAKLKNLVGALLVTGILFTANLLNAGFIYQMEQSGQSGATSVMKLTVDSGNLKIGNPDTKEEEMIYSASSKTMTVIDHKSRSYLQLDQAAIKKITTQMNQAMAEYERALQSAPAAQRQMMEQMLRQQMPGMAQKKAPTIEVIHTGNSTETNNYPTTVYQVKTDGKKTQELFVTAWENLQGSENVMSTLQEMSGFMNEMLKAMSTGPMADMMPGATAKNWLDQLGEINGFPVLVKEYDNGGNIISETKLLSIEEASIAPETFQAPTNYRRQSLEF